MSNHEHTHEARVRRLARRHGLTQWKVPERSRAYPEHGPYALTDPSTKGVGPSGLPLVEVEEWLRCRP